MKQIAVLVTLALSLILWSSAVSETIDFGEFKRNYAALDLDLLNNACESGKVENFVYKKDIATFTFEKGTFYLLRYVNERPTTAIFIGKGRAHIDSLTTPVEMENLVRATGTPSVDETFDICLIRMADDFDLALHEATEFSVGQLAWRQFTLLKKSQGEVYFKPIIQHTYDNYFQLLHSVYERGEDGYFWIDFNRYVFSYDPNRPEEVMVGYEYEGGDLAITEAARLQRQELGVKNSRQTSDVPYSTTLLSQDATLRMGGLDGTRLEDTRATMTLEINADSLRFISLYLHYNLKEDSIHFNGKAVDYWRRKDFSFIGTILPEYVHKGDTVEFTLWYKGKDFMPALPWVENPRPAPHTMLFAVPKGYTYIMPDMGPVGSAGNVDTFTVVTSKPYRRFVCQGYAGGYEPISLISDFGTPITVLQSQHLQQHKPECLIPDEDYQAVCKGSFDYLAGLLGMPMGVFGLTVYPDSTLSMPGLVEIPQEFCYQSGTGGIAFEAGRQMARQWFGSTMRPKSEREYWLMAAMPAYLGLMYTEGAIDKVTMYMELAGFRSYIYTNDDKNGDQPLGIGARLSPSVSIYKGAFLIHQLRMLMYDFETGSERAFQTFLRDVCAKTNNELYTNADIQALAEKHYGAPLGWFFDQWLYGRGFPEYKGEYRIEKRDDGYYVTAKIKTEKVHDGFPAPVVVRVEFDDGTNAFYRKPVTAPESEMVLGPYAEKPKEFYFNEFLSVLCDSNIKKK